MMYSLGKHKVDKASGVYLAPGCHVIGQVKLEKNVSVWFNAVIRGDSDLITVGEDSNIQDGAILHTDKGGPMSIGKGVTVGHKVMLHGCSIQDYSLIGINSVVLNGAKIGKHCVIGANSLVTENMEIPDGSLVMGSPAKVVKSIPQEQRKLLEKSAQHYVHNGKWFSEALKIQS
ncbi:gamma carbonic anhydrase family protein [Paraglaciecola sp. 2405UD69-4]|uniref:gamma carbonic anhydrase family protein n=1 Tax=Paraglaciecola sp. 2405UD69-4 TaxID=3391836 RepID=UPI0039C93A8B